MKCTQCGNEIPEGKKFCGHCGARLEVPKPTAQPADVKVSHKEGFPPPEPDDWQGKTIQDPDPSHTSAGQISMVEHDEQNNDMLELGELKGQDACPQCGHLNLVEARFCNRCGANLTSLPMDHSPRQETGDKEPQTDAEQQTALDSKEQAEKEPVIKASRYWMALIILILGWGLGGLAADLARNEAMTKFIYINYTRAQLIIVGGAVVFNVVGSLFTVLAARLISKKMTWGRSLLLILGWIIASFVMGLDSLLNCIFFGIGYWWFIGLLLGGVSTGLIFSRLFPLVRWKHVILMTLSWVAGAVPGLIVAGMGSAVREGYGYRSIPITHNLGSGLLFGAVCGGLTLLIVGLAERKSRKQRTIA